MIAVHIQYVSGRVHAVSVVPLVEEERGRIVGWAVHRDDTVLRPLPRLARRTAMTVMALLTLMAPLTLVTMIALVTTAFSLRLVQFRVSTTSCS